MATARHPKPTAVPTAEACAAEVIDVLPIAMNAMRTAMRQRIGEGLSVPQFRCLNFVDMNPGASMGEVAGFLGVTLATASALSDRMVQAGLMSTAAALDDRRRVELHSLPAGRRLLAAMRKATLAEFAHLMQALPEADRQMLWNGMQVLKTTFAPR